MVPILYCSEAGRGVEIAGDVFDSFVVGGELDVNPLLFFSGCRVMLLAPYQKLWHKHESHVSKSCSGMSKSKLCY